LDLECTLKLLDCEVYTCLRVEPAKDLFVYVDEEAAYKPELRPNEVCSLLTGYHIKGKALVVQIRPGEQDVLGITGEQELQLHKYLKTNFGGKGLR
jgi:hypothetical protein